MHNSPNDKLVTIIKQYIPLRKNLVQTLMQLLSLGKESIYRRLRSEIPFTFDEVVKISVRFGISLDAVVDKSEITGVSQWAVLDLDKFFLPASYTDQHCDRLIMYMDVIQNMQQAKKAVVRSACNFIPYSFLLPYQKLNLLWHYKWSYLVNGVKPDFLFSKMILPDKLIALEKQFEKQCQKIPRAILILDKDAFMYIINDVNYFFEQQLVTEEELLQIKGELLDLISFIEILADKGMYETGAEIDIYLSRINIDTCYYHLEYDDMAYCLQKTFFIDKLDFSNNKLCEKQKHWIELLKRYSFPITQSGETNRFDFFKKQRKLVERLGMNCMEREFSNTKF